MVSIYAVVKNQVKLRPKNDLYDCYLGWFILFKGVKLVKILQICGSRLIKPKRENEKKKTRKKGRKRTLKQNFFQA